MFLRKTCALLFDHIHFCWLCLTVSTRTFPCNIFWGRIANTQVTTRWIVQGTIFQQKKHQGVQIYNVHIHDESVSRKICPYQFWNQPISPFDRGWVVQEALDEMEKSPLFVVEKQNSAKIWCYYCMVQCIQCNLEQRCFWFWRGSVCSGCLSILSHLLIFHLSSLSLFLGRQSLQYIWNDCLERFVFAS